MDSRSSDTQPFTRESLYDLIYSKKDYHVEAQTLNDIIESYQPNAASLLDIACGTGEHLRFLKDKYQCKGVDYSREMLSIAKEKLPDVPFYHDDMRTFYMGERFDVVMCLFSAIGYMLTVADLEKAVQNMANHVARGGVLLLEPWLTPDIIKPGHKGFEVVQASELNLVRMNTVKIDSTKEPPLSYLDMSYMVGTADKVETFSETLTLAVFSQAQYEQAFKKAGLALEISDLTGRGLYVGIKD